MRTKLCQSWLFCRKDLPDGALPSCEESGFETVSLPHDWAIASARNPKMPYGGEQGFFDRYGVGWYRLHFVVGETPLRRFLRFGGVFECCSVYLNGTLLGTHNYGYSGFSFEITDAVHTGENLLAVRVDNSVAPQDRWYSGCGIYRPVELEELPQVFLRIEDVALTTDYENGRGSLRLRVKFPWDTILAETDDDITGDVSTAAENSTCLALPCVVASIDGLFCEKIPENGELTVSDLEVSPWSAESPVLYDLKLAILEPEESTLQMRIGFRRVEFLPGNGLSVNGTPVKLKGVCLHHDGGCVGSAVTKSLLRHRLELIKSMGCNMIRTSHNIVSEDMMDLCDEMGFYVLDECFDKWVQGSYSRFYETDAKADLSYLVLRDRNRPSVVMWSVGNEVGDQGSAPMLAILARLCGIVRKLDVSRPVTAALAPHYTNLAGEPVEEHVEDKIAAISRVAAIVDVLGLNYQEQWYEAIHEALPDKLIFGTETYLFFRGSYNHYFNYGTDSSWLDVEKNPYVIGCCLWAGVDYLGESMLYPSRGWAGAAIHTNLVRKPISWLWESCWSEKPVVHISILDYTQPMEIVREHWSEMPFSDCWNYPMFQLAPMPYAIFTNCQEVRLSQNGKGLDIPKPAGCKNHMITGFLPLEPGEVLVEGINDGEVVCSHRLVSSGASARLEFEETLFDKETIRQGTVGMPADKELTRPAMEDSPAPKVLAEPMQLLFTVKATDANGVWNPRESQEVIFSVEGPCKIEGVDNGYLCSLDAPASDRIHMHQGRASVVLRIKGSGRIVLHARAAGLAGSEKILQFSGKWIREE
ncbi:MAG: glycoside hydrolase family 2 protein [Lachnospiraceae bacterium]|nr:glycoside hydrolase family 2 protein [Lachnospiraceae bacterium]